MVNCWDSSPGFEHGNNKKIHILDFQADLESTYYSEPVTARTDARVSGPNVLYIYIVHMYEYCTVYIYILHMFENRCTKAKHIALYPLQPYNRRCLFLCEDSGYISYNPKSYIFMRRFRLYFVQSKIIHLYAKDFIYDF